MSQFEPIEPNEKIDFSKLDKSILYDMALNDLAKGLTNSVVAGKYGLNANHLSTKANKPENKAFIEAGKAKIIAQRQAKWDKFLEEEEDSLLEFCAQSREMLREAMRKTAAKLKKGEEMETVEVTKKDSDGIVKTAPVMTVDRAMKVYKDVRDTFGKMQKDAE